ncbi:MAG: efflux transporter outer membrane subunit [Phycisphaerae bacterium]|nr:efflux transporter outer membrane subunit [Phycisphaerae bacterium]
MRYLNYTLLCILYICSLTITGCMVGPNYKPPQTSVPSAWTGTADQNTAAMDLVHWWTQFNDPNLASLIERAVESNLDLKQAESRLRQARAARRVVSAGLWPTIDAKGSYKRSQSAGTATAPGVRNDLWQTGLDAVWEIDIFGGVRRNVEAAESDIQAAVEDQRDVLVTLVSEVALNYIELRGYQQEIVISQNNLKAQQRTVELTRQRFNSGLVGALDVANADAQVGTTASQIPVMETSARQTIYNLSVLLGREPAALLEELSPTSTIPVNPPTLPAELPSVLLRRRPDIRRAEAKIHAATARIGVATADLFPKFNLTGSAGYQTSTSFDGMVNSRYGFWSVGPSIDWQIFNAGSVNANIEVKKALTEQALLTYQKAVLTALQDVENALVAYSKEQQRNKALEDTAAANRKAVDLATQLYSQGQTEFLSVLDAQRSLYASEDSLVQSNRNLSTDLVALYKALGGGWEEEEPNAVGVKSEPNLPAEAK